MRRSVLFLGAALLAAAAMAPAHAQTIVSMGKGLAHDCFAYAKAGVDPYDGVEVCNQSIDHEALTVKDRAATYDNRGVMLDMLGRLDKASADFRQSMALDPKLGDPYVNLGSVMIKQKRYDEALVSINKGLDLGVSFPHIGYYDRAVAYQLLGRYKEAYYDYKKTLELEPNFTQASDRLKDFTVTRTPAKVPG
ncbi:MAG TPA: tetratricopeptide repeat protein [Rhizomicrobium sp.]|jgi:tetratricopeptide (TPR) repeat protein